MNIIPRWPSIDSPLREQDFSKFHRVRGIQLVGAICAACWCVLAVTGCFPSHRLSNTNLTHITYNPLTDELLVVRTADRRGAAPSGTQHYEVLANNPVTGVYTPLTTVSLPVSSTEYPLIEYPYYADPTGLTIDTINNQLLLLIPPIGLLGIDLTSYTVTVLSDANDLNLGPDFESYADLLFDEIGNRAIAITHHPLAELSTNHRIISIDLQTGIRTVLAGPPPPAGMSAATVPPPPKVYCCDDIALLNGVLYIVSREKFYSIDLLTGTEAVIRDDFPLNMRITASPDSSQLLLVSVENHSIAYFDVITQSITPAIPANPPSSGTTFLKGIPNNAHLTGRMSFASSHGLFAVAPYSMLPELHTVDYLHRIDLVQGSVSLHDVERFNSIEMSETGLENQRRIKSDILERGINKVMISILAIPFTILAGGALLIDLITAGLI